MLSYLEKGKNIIIINIGLLSIVTMLLAGHYLFLSKLSERCTNTKIILTPFYGNSDVWVSGNKASDDYLEKTAYPFLISLGNLSYTNTKRVKNWILNFVWPEYLDTVKAKLNAISKELNKSDISQSFIPAKITVDPDKNLIIGEGIHSRIIQGVAMEASRKKVSIQYILVKGKFYVKDIFVPDFNFE